VTDHPKAQPGAYSRRLGEIPLPLGGVAIFNKPRATRHHELLTGAKGFVSAITLATNRARLRAFKAHRVVLASGLGDLTEDKFDAQQSTITWCDTAIAALEESVCAEGDVEASVSPAEVAAVCVYLAEHTLRLEGVDDVDWGELTEEARVDFYELLGPDVGTVLAHVIAAMNDLHKGGQRG